MSNFSFSFHFGHQSAILITWHFLGVWGFFGLLIMVFPKAQQLIITILLLNRGNRSKFNKKKKGSSYSYFSYYPFYISREATCKRLHL